jgi:putative NADPH-quinone reductase
LLIHAHPADESFSRALARTATDALTGAGHHVDAIDLHADGFEPRMSRAEREAYESDAPISDPLVRRYADLVEGCEAMVFVYPTWWGGVPAILKGWFERVLVPGVAFHLDPVTQRVTSDLTNIRRLVGITTTRSTRRYLFFTTDHGRRLIMRSLRLSTRKTARTTWLALHDIENTSEFDRAEFIERVSSRLEAF